MKTKIAAALMLLIAMNAIAEEGPMQEPLRVVQTYTGDASDRIYIRFNSGAMPGCYADSGGRLYLSDPFFKATYSQILVLMAGGGMRGRVVFENQAGPGWSVCKITGLALYP